MPLRVTSPNGNPGDPQTGITPIFVQVEPGHLRVVGTGFYIARYGLLLTAKHVVEELGEHDAKGNPSLAWNWTSTGSLHIQPILTCTFPTSAPRAAADIAICQAVASARDGQIRFGAPNERIALVNEVPTVGSHVGTYAYPGNASVDFRNAEKRAQIFADLFEGQVLELLGPGDRYLKYEHIETSIEVRAGASGGPVFAQHGHAFAVNCRGWDFSGSENDAPLSSVVPVRHIFDLELPLPYMPKGSFEENSVPANRIGGNVTLRDLAEWGHIVIALQDRPNNSLQRDRYG